MLRTKKCRALIAAVMIGTWGCGGGSGPGVSPADDAAGPGDAREDGAASDEASDVPPLCLSHAECDDGNPCTNNTCEADGCHHEPLVTGACDDGDPCTAGESCQGGVCGGGDFVCECKNDADCPAASDPCRVRTCDLDAHVCVEGPRDNGTPCDDANPCTEGEACWDGACTGGAQVCDCEKDSDCPAPEDECSPLKCDLSDHTCQADPKPDGTGCDDGDACTLEDKCKEGTCVPGAPKDCDDKDACTKDSCDPGSGACGHEYQPQFGCCASDADCDDADPCTVEECVTHQCVRSGEPGGATGVGCASVTGCSAGFCSEEDGGCRSLTVDLPAVLFDWDLTAGAPPKGMRWTTEAGGLTAQGAGPGAGEGLAGFAFPGRFVPAGVRVLVLTLGEGLDCAAQAKVQVKADGQPAVGASGCAIEAGQAVLGFPFASDATSRLDLEVLVHEGATVARATLYLHAVPSCRPLGAVVAVPGTGVSDLSVAGSRTGIGVGHRFQGETIRFGRYSLWNGVKGLAHPASGKMTAMVPHGGDRFLFAYDGVPEGGGPSRIEVALLDTAGQVVARAMVPRGDEAASQSEPFLVVTEAGTGYLAYTTSEADAEGLGIAFRSVKAAASVLVFGDPVTVNINGAGDQTLPVLSWSGSEGIVVWKSSVPGEVVPNSLRLRKVSPAGPEGLEFKVVESSDVYQSLAVIPVGDQFLVAATTQAGVLKGFRVLSDFSAVQTWTEVPQTGKWSDVTLLPATTGAMLVATLLDAGVARVVQVPVSQFGQMGEAVALSGPIEKSTATPVLGAFGPFLEVLAFNDTLSAKMGARVALLAAKCASGPVSCESGHASVCTGLGGTGYVQVAGADAWCP